MEPSSVEDELDAKNRALTLQSALAHLDPLTRTIITEQYGLGVESDPNMLFQASHLSQKERNALISQAFDILRKNDKLKKFLDDL